MAPRDSEKHGHVVQRVSPRRDAEASRQVERAERESRQSSENERLQAQRFAERSNVVERREEQSADDHRDRACGNPSETEKLEAIREERDDHHPEQQLLVQSRAQRQREPREWSTIEPAAGGES